MYVLLLYHKQQRPASTRDEHHTQQIHTECKEVVFICCPLCGEHASQVGLWMEVKNASARSPKEPLRNLFLLCILSGPDTRQHCMRIIVSNGRDTQS